MNQTAKNAMSSGSPERTRLLMAVAIGLAIVTAAYYGFSFYRGLSDDIDASIDLKRAQYAKFSRFIQEEASIRQLNTELTGFRGQLVADRFIPGATKPLVEARMQNIIKGLADDSGLDITSLRILPSQPENGLAVITLFVNGQGSMESIRDFLLNVGEDGHLLLFRELSIRQISPRETRFYRFSAKLAGLSVL